MIQLTVGEINIHTLVYIHQLAESQSYIQNRKTNLRQHVTSLYIRVEEHSPIPGKGPLRPTGHYQLRRVVVLYPHIRTISHTCALGGN